MSLALRDELFLLVYVGERLIKQSWQASLVAGTRFQEQLHCEGLRRVSRIVQKRKLPLLFVVTPHGPIQDRRPYLGLPLDDREFMKLVDCARGTGAAVVDLRSELEKLPELFWKNDWHFNSAGVEALITQMEMRTPQEILGAFR